MHPTLCLSHPPPFPFSQNPFPFKIYFSTFRLPFSLEPPSIVLHLTRTTGGLLIGPIADRVYSYPTLLYRTTTLSSLLSRFDLSSFQLPSPTPHLKSTHDLTLLLALNAFSDPNVKSSLPYPSLNVAVPSVPPTLAFHPTTNLP